MTSVQTITSNSSPALISKPLLSESIARFADQNRYYLFALVLLFYLVGFNGQWQIEPDSALYLDVGKNISLGRGYTYHGMPHALAYPGLPYALAGIFRIFGSHAIAAADAFILVCGLIGIACSYRMVLLAFDRPTAVVVAIGVGTSHELFRYCFEIMTDVPFFMGVMAFLAGYQGVFARADGSRRRWWDWGLLIGGLIVFMSTRPTMLGLLAVWIATMLIQAIYHPKSRKIIFPALGISIAAVLIFWLLDPRHGQQNVIGTYEQFAVYTLTHNLGQRLHNEIPANLKDLFYISAARSIFGASLGTWWLNAIGGAVLLICGMLLVRRNLIWGLWVAVSTVMMIFFVSHDRYMLQILPLLVLGWWLLLRRINAGLPRWLGNVVFALLLSGGVALNVVEVIHVILEQRASPFLAHYKEGRFPAYVQLAGDLPKFASPTERIVCPVKYARILTFLSDRTVMESGEFSAGPPGEQVLVVLDRSDPDYIPWLASQPIEIDPTPIASYPRVNVKMPLLLMSGKIK